MKNNTLKRLYVALVFCTLILAGIFSMMLIGSKTILPTIYDLESVSSTPASKEEYLSIDGQNADFSTASSYTDYIMTMDFSLDLQSGGYMSVAFNMTETSKYSTGLYLYFNSTDCFLFQGASDSEADPTMQDDYLLRIKKNYADGQIHSITAVNGDDGLLIAIDDSQLLLYGGDYSVIPDNFIDNAQSRTGYLGFKTNFWADAEISRFTVQQTTNASSISGAINQFLCYKSYAENVLENGYTVEVLNGAVYDDLDNYILSYLTDSSLSVSNMTYFKMSDSERELYFAIQAVDTEFFALKSPSAEGSFAGWVSGGVLTKSLYTKIETTNNIFVSAVLDFEMDDAVSIRTQGAGALMWSAKVDKPYYDFLSNIGLSVDFGMKQALQTIPFDISISWHRLDDTDYRFSMVIDNIDEKFYGYLFDVNAFATLTDSDENETEFFAQSDIQPQSLSTIASKLLADVLDEANSEYCYENGQGKYSKFDDTIRAYFEDIVSNGSEWEDDIVPFGEEDLG